MTELNPNHKFRLATDQNKWAHVGARNLEDLAWGNAPGLCSSLCVGESCYLIELGTLEWWPVNQVCYDRPVLGGKSPRTCPRLGRCCLWSPVKVWATLVVFLQQSKPAKCFYCSSNGARSSISLMSCLLCVKTYNDSQMRAAPSSWGNVWGVCGCHDDGEGVLLWC